MGDINKLEGITVQQVALLTNDKASQAKLRKVIQTIQNDDPAGQAERVDSGVETYNLARFLVGNAPAGLKLTITSADLESYRQKFELPKASKEKSFEAVHIRQRGEALREVNSKFLPYYKSHFDLNQANVLQAAKVMEGRLLGKKVPGHSDPAKRPVVMLLGSGECADLPLKELAEKYRVILVDIDEVSVQAAVNKVPQTNRKFVSYEIRDLSEGMVLDFVGKAKGIILEAAKDTKNPTVINAHKARQKLEALMNDYKVPVPLLADQHPVDLMVSSLLVSQIATFPLEEMNNFFKEKFPGMALPSLEIISRFSGRVHDAHAEALRDYAVRDQGVVYYSSDLVFLYRYLYETAPSKYEEHFPSNGAKPLLMHNGTVLLELGNLYQSDKDIHIVYNHPEMDKWVWNERPAELESPLEKVAPVDLDGDGRPDKAQLIPIRRGVIKWVDGIIFTSK